MTKKINEDVLMEMDPHVLKALIREAVHHGVETRLLPSIAGKREPFEVPNKVKTYMAVYERRGLNMDQGDIRWAKFMIEWAEFWKAGNRPEFEGHTPTTHSSDKTQTVRSVLLERRSVRQWTGRKVSRELLRNLVEVGTYAPTACNLQVTRYLVLDSEEDLKAMPSREFSGEAAKIIVLADRRPYEILSHIPRRNLILDVGAAMQNILIMAEALGLAACWATLNDREIENIRSYFNLPEFYEIVTYVSLGYGDEKVVSPGRISVEEAILNW